MQASPDARPKLHQTPSEDSETQRPVKPQKVQNFVGFISEENSSMGKTLSTGSSAARTSEDKGPASEATLVEHSASPASNQKQATDPAGEGSVKAQSAGASRASPAEEPATHSEG